MTDVVTGLQRADSSGMKVGSNDGYHSFVILCIPRWPLVLTISSRLWRTSQGFTRRAPHLMKPGFRHLFTSICEPDVYNIHNSSQTVGGGVRNAFPSFFPLLLTFMCSSVQCPTQNVPKNLKFSMSVSELMVPKIYIVRRIGNPVSLSCSQLRCINSLADVTLCQ